ncbi:MAG: potassium channel family protein [Actinomycetota bacterium]|nr:potassium channel family protein [Actinomycetota bacterium]MDP9019929.1 potassium channel family protein [Actinomycetota bacterium]
MDLIELVSLVVGAVLAAGVALDVFFTVAHADIEGRVARTAQRSVWAVFVALSRRWRTRQRSLLAMAGPAMIATTLVLWVVLFILGFALVFYSGLDSHRAQAELGPLGFVDALYHSGVTVTVLGYGDITPITAPYKALAFVASGGGFALLTGVVTYLIEVTSSLDERYRLSLLLQDETEGTREGVTLAAAGLETGDVQYLQTRYDELADHLRQVQDKAHRYALVALYYRSRDPLYDFEPTLELAGEVALAGHLLAEDPSWAAVRPAVRHLDAGVSRLMRTIADRHLGPEVASDLADTVPDDDDRRTVREVRERLRQAGADIGPQGDSEAPLRVAARSRVFLRGLQDITGRTLGTVGDQATPPSGGTPEEADRQAS